MASVQVPPTVYPELNALLLEGQGLVVRNTFIEVATPKFEPVIRRSASAPVERVNSLSDDEESDECTPAAPSEPLPEVRKKLPLPGVEARAGVSLKAWQDAETSPVHRRGGGDSCCSGKGFEADELASNASTRAVSPSNRSFLSNPSNFSYDASFMSRSQSMIEEEGETTFVIRGLPSSMSRRCFEELLDAEGFAGMYNFLHVSSDVKAGVCYGEGLINLINTVEAERFVDHFHGFTWSDADMKQPLGVHTSESLQGLDDLVERYRNSPLMHKSVPADMRPSIYCSGVLAAFPSPTVRLRPLRVRGSQHRKPLGQKL